MNRDEIIGGIIGILCGVFFGLAGEAVIDLIFNRRKQHG